MCVFHVNVECLLAMLTIYRHIYKFSAPACKYSRKLHSCILIYAFDVFKRFLDTFDQLMAYVLFFFQLDYVGLDRPILVPFMPQGEMAGWKVMSAVERVLQSYQEINIQRPVHINVVQVRNPTGAGKFGPSYAHSHRLDLQRSKKLIPTCDGDWDNLCFPKAVMLGWFYLVNRARYKELSTDHLELRRVARETLRRAGVTHDQACGMEEVKQVQAVSNARIIVYDRQMLNATIHAGPRRQHTIHICLFEGHYTLIRSIKSYMNCSYYCVECKV